MSAIDHLHQQVRDAVHQQRSLRIVGGDTKAHLGQPINADAVLSTRDLRGIVNYQPTELMVSVAAGTPLAELEATLAESGQQLPFEPLRFGSDTQHDTIGGCVACGLSGPARPWQGAVRDALLGIRLINGHGELLRFGGEVMKNVAGFDATRLMCGAQGTLGVITELSIKVIPIAECTRTMSWSSDFAQAQQAFHALSAKPWPLSGLAWRAGRAYARFHGSVQGVSAASAHLTQQHAGTEDDGAVWADLIWQRFAPEAPEVSATPHLPLWRVSLPVTAAPVVPAATLLAADWGGALRWCHADTDLHASAHALGGHAQCHTPSDALPSLVAHGNEAYRTIERRLRDAFDPLGVFNPGRLPA